MIRKGLGVFGESVRELDYLRRAIHDDGFAVVRDSAFADHLLASMTSVSPPQELRPRPRGDGWSLSDSYGYGKFPWHTDGAVSRRAPRWFSLRAVEIDGETSTELLDLPSKVVGHLRNVVLKVRAKSDNVRYLPAILPLSHRRYQIRWDPRTCAPNRTTVLEEVESCGATEVVRWHVGATLFVDNYRLLHRRPKVAEDSGRALERRYIWSM